MHLFVCLFVCLFVFCLVADLDGQVHSAQHVFLPLDVVSIQTIHEWWNLLCIEHLFVWELFSTIEWCLSAVHYYSGTCDDPLH